MSEIEVWTVLIPAISGLLGAAIGGLASIFAMRVQLNHQATEANRERQHALKRSVYLEASEGVAGGVRYLASFGRIEIPVQRLADLADARPGWLHKVHAVGNPETIEAFDGAGEFLFSRSLDLMVKRVALDSVRAEVEAIQDKISRLTADGQRLVTTLQTVSIPTATAESRGLVPDLARRLLSTQELLAEAGAEQDHAMTRQKKQHVDLVLASMKAVSDYQRHLSRANVCVRRELELPLDATEYLSRIDAMSARSQERLKAVLDSIDDEAV